MARRIRWRSMAGSCLLCVVVSATVFAGEAAGDGEKKFDPAARAALIRSCVDDQTVAVLHADMTRINVDAFLAQLAKDGKLRPEEIAGPLQEARARLSAFIKAGGTEVYVVLSLDDLQGIVVPLTKKGDPAAMGKVFGRTARKRRGRFGEGLGLHILESGRGREIEEAFAAAGDTAVQILLVPGTSACRKVEGEMQWLPQEFGGGPVTVLTRDVKWAAIGFDGPPRGSLQVLIQCENAGVAKALRTLITHSLKAAGNKRWLGEALPDFEEIARQLTPALDGNRLTLKLKGEHVNTLIANLVAVPLVQAQASARRAKALSAVHNILIGCLAYAQDHDEKWPDNLQALLPRYVGKEGLKNPRRPGLEVGFVYVKPGATFNIARPGQKLMVYEAYEKWPRGGIATGFADAHAEIIRTEAEFKKRLEASKQVK